MAHPHLNPTAVAIATEALQSYYELATPPSRFDSVPQNVLHNHVVSEVMRHKSTAFTETVAALCSKYPNINPAGITECKAMHPGYWPQPVLAGLTQLVDAFCSHVIDKIMQHRQAAASSSGTGNTPTPAQVDITPVCEAAKNQVKSFIRKVTRKLMAEPNYTTKDRFCTYVAHKFKEYFCNNLPMLGGLFNPGTAQKCLDGQNVPPHLIWAHAFSTQKYVDAEQEITQYASAKYDEVSRWQPNNGQWIDGGVVFQGKVQNQGRNVVRKFAHIVIPAWAHNANSKNEKQCRAAYSWAEMILIAMEKRPGPAAPGAISWSALQFALHPDKYITFPRLLKARNVIVHYQLNDAIHRRLVIRGQLNNRAGHNSNSNNNAEESVLNDDVKSLLVTLKEIIFDEYYKKEARHQPLND